MKFRFAIVEKSLGRAEFRWKWLRFLRYSFLLGGILCLLAILFAAAIHNGMIVSKPAAIAISVMLAGTALIAWCIILIVVVASSPDRNWLAAALERVDRRFLDRLNTLLFLEKKRTDKVDSFAVRIAQQTRDTFAIQLPRRPF